MISHYFLCHNLDILSVCLLVILFPNFDVSIVLLLHCLGILMFCLSIFSLIPMSHVMRRVVFVFVFISSETVLYSHRSLLDATN